MTQLYVCHHSSIKVCHDALIGMPCLNPMCAMTHSYESTWDFSPGSNSLVSISTWLNYACAITRLHTPWLIHRCAIPQSYVCHDLFYLCMSTCDVSPGSDSLVSISPQLNYMCAITRIHMPWLMYIRHGTHTTYMSWHTYNMCAMTRIHNLKKKKLLHITRTRMPWLIHVCAMPQ